MLSAAIGSMKRNRTVRECRSYLDDVPRVAGKHAPQGRHCSVNRTEIRDFRGALEFLWGHVRDQAEDRSHGVIHPDGDWSELFFDPRGRRLHLIGIGDVGGYSQTLP